jgi:hypothetical protein
VYVVLEIQVESQPMSLVSPSLFSAMRNKYCVSLGGLEMAKWLIQEVRTGRDVRKDLKRVARAQGLWVGKPDPLAIRVWDIDIHDNRKAFGGTDNRWPFRTLSNR